MTTDSRLIPRAPIPARSRDRNAKTAKVFVLTLMSFMVCFSLFCRVGGRLPRAFTKGAFLFFFVENDQFCNEPVAAKSFIV
ncbi:hypothetical protein [Azospirillum argentinense]|uniref:hypothetical protein n=1 Tax=Azospirillum argentinense TaxID=2970906 RepID=UPI001585ECC4|nr:hypothetical protein [Azospirillum argentinense]